MANADIDTLRKEVDKLDRKLWQILSERMDITVQIRRLRNETRDEARENLILSRAREVCQGLLSGEFCADLMKRIMDESIRLQNQPLSLVSFRGMHGSFGELAARQYDPSCAPIPSLELSEVFEAVANDRVDCAVVPLEGVLERTESEGLNLLIDSKLSIVGEVLVPIKHALLITPGTSHRELQEAYSSVASLSRCRAFLKRNRLISKPVIESAAAAGMLARGEIEGAAVIASAYAAELYGLEVLVEGIDDRPNDTMRYVTIAKHPSNERGNRCSITFVVEHKSGSLQEVLEIFGQAGINLLSIQSIIGGGAEDTVRFALDFKGSDKDEHVARALEKVASITSGLRLLGSYYSKAAE